MIDIDLQAFLRNAAGAVHAAPAITADLLENNKRPLRILRRAQGIDAPAGAVLDKFKNGWFNDF
jgi:hypothetical protein